MYFLTSPLSVYRVKSPIKAFVRRRDHPDHVLAVKLYVRVCVGRSTASKDASTTKASVPADVPQKSIGILRAPLGAAINAFWGIVERIIVAFSPPLSCCNEDTSVMFGQWVEDMVSRMRLCFYLHLLCLDYD